MLKTQAPEVIGRLYKENSLPNIIITEKEVVIYQEMRGRAISVVLNEEARYSVFLLTEQHANWHKN